MDAGLDMQREIWTSDRFRDLAGILFGAVVVVKGVDDANGARNSENTSCVCGWKLLMEIGYAGASRTDAYRAVPGTGQSNESK